VEDVWQHCLRLPAPRLHSLGNEVVEPREAALLIPIIDLGGQAGVVVTRRPETMTYHRGDWVFPGGSVDTIDQSIAAAARREVCEELGIPEDRLTVVGQLDSHGPIMTGFIIHAFVGVVVPGTALAPDPHEVAEVLVVPLSTLLDPASLRSGDTMPEHRPGPAAASPFGRPVPVPPRKHSGRLLFVRLGPADELWGTQAEILFNLLAHLTAQEAD